ncbi:MAG: hypothetical protein CM15mP51_23310 [Porticoccaceae bacterium]|nr:MAG: hypothetical protein CM15mP51_23310 [Porticoccaceae bacterium]
MDAGAVATDYADGSVEVSVSGSVDSDRGFFFKNPIPRLIVGGMKKNQYTNPSPVAIPPPKFFLCSENKKILALSGETLGRRMNYSFLGKTYVLKDSVDKKISTQPQ